MLKLNLPVVGATPAMVDLAPFLPGLSPVQGKTVVARFDGGRLSSEGGLLALREIERRLGLADRLANCLVDPRAPERVVHRLAEIIRFRMLMIAAGYENGNDADTLRRDPMFKLALDRLPDLWRKISPSRDLPLSRSLGRRRRPGTVQKSDAISLGSAQTSGRKPIGRLCSIVTRRVEVAYSVCSALSASMPAGLRSHSQKSWNHLGIISKTNFVAHMSGWSSSCGAAKPSM